MVDILNFLNPVHSAYSLFNTICQRLGWDKDYLQKINDPNFDKLRDLDRLIYRLRIIYKTGAQIVVMPDFDMDGITSGIIAYAALAELGFNTELYIPDFRRGHDISVEAAEELCEQYPQAAAVITTDSGVNSHEGIGFLKDKGLKVFVTDHHVQLDQDSPADIIINPSRIDENYSNKGVCGAFVIWQVMLAYAKQYESKKVRDIELLKLFAGIGTISDVMPLVYENRQLVKDSLAIAKMLYVPLDPADHASEYNIDDSTLLTLLNNGDHDKRYLDAFEGFALVLKAFREYGEEEIVTSDADGNTKVERGPGKLRHPRDINEEFYGFYLSPVFNAIRRIDGDMHDAFGVFTAKTREEKYDHACRLIDANRERKKLTEKLLEQVKTRPQPYRTANIFFCDTTAAMLGLVAAQLMSETNLPTIVVNEPHDGMFAGSARAPRWFNIVSEINTDPLFHAVGHEQACGVQFPEDTIDDFADFFSEKISLAILSDAAKDDINSRVALTFGDFHKCDANLDDPSELLELGFLINALRPFGNGFPHPSFKVILDPETCVIKTIGSKNSHIQFTTKNGVRLMAWNSADRLNEFANAQTIQLLARLNINTFMGNVRPQFIVEDIIRVE